jgi:hypothetical protein
MKLLLALGMGVVAILVPLALLYLVFFAQWSSSVFDRLLPLAGCTLGLCCLWLAYVTSKMLSKRKS